MINEYSKILQETRAAAILDSQALRKELSKFEEAIDNADKIRSILAARNLASSIRVKAQLLEMNFISSSSILAGYQVHVKVLKEKRKK